MTKVRLKRQGRKPGTTIGPIGLRSSKVSSLTMKILKTIFRLRGATTWSIEHELAVRGIDTSHQTIAVMLCQLLKRGYVWSEVIPCKCCRKEGVIYYLTDDAKAMIHEGSSYSSLDLEPANQL